jgi:hypothetical protein
VIETVEQITTFTQTNLIGQIKQTFATLPDARSGDGIYQKYDMSDAALSAFSVFFMQSPSFLDYQKTMEKEGGKNNARSLFGIHLIPSANQIRNLLDPVPAETISPIYREILRGLQQSGKINEFHVLDKTILVAIDGVEYFSSQSIHCDCCSTKTLKNGKTHYSHVAVTPVIVSPRQSAVIPLVPEFITPQDGSEKQDYELATSKRWLEKEANDLPGNTTFLGDDLYCKQPFCEQVIQMKKHFILVCKPDSHKTLYEWIDDFERSGEVENVIVNEWTGKKKLKKHYRFVNRVPLRDTDDALFVNWCELTITDDKNKVIYHNAFATDYLLDRKNIKQIIEAGRTRWKIENENNNTLKTKGYNFKHNFGHGKQHLSSLLASLNILAFLVHTVLEWFDQCYALVRNELTSRQTFFDDIRALTRYMHFDSWQSLLEFMLRGLEIPIPEI